MGSGLILLVIVGAWLAVLVPMALKSHDTTASLKSADRFSDAMQVLSGRRPSVCDRRDVVMPPRPPVRRESASRPAATPAERRRRTLLVLLGLSLVTLGLALVLGVVLLIAHVVLDVLLVGFVVHCRRQAVIRARRRVRTVTADSSAVRPVARRTAAAPTAVHREPRLTGIPDRMPRRPAPAPVPAPVPAARYDDAVATGTDGWDSSWEPVPVPPPTYVGKPKAPVRPQRIVDLTKPGQWTATLEGEDAGLAIFDDEHELEDILDRRRAVNDW